MSRGFTRNAVIILSLVGLFSGCSAPFATNGTTVSVASTSEESFCPSISSYPTGLTVTSTANYYYRATNVVFGLYGDPLLEKISYAEVVVKNSAGTIVQCGNTDAAGAISVVVPKVADTYTLFVNSRANNAKLHASILQDINSNAYYSISQTFTVAASDSSPKAVVLAPASARMVEDSQIKGGAFNILKDIYRTNEYIRSALSDSTWAAPKVTVYWKAGFNPNSYRDPSYANSGLSYYSTGNRKLYILGGISGQVKNVDTDHFDDSVIIHEYGHFLEDVYAKQDSPGGSHNGNNIIDPRLAWSEGWANFVQSAVQTNWSNASNGVSADANVSRGKLYIDTIGFSGDSVETSGSGSIAISFNLTLAGGSAAGEDAVTSAGEGTFREMSVARTLFKSIATVTTNASLHGDVPFAAVWSAFSGASSGMASSSATFRNIGLFNLYLDSVITASYSSVSAAWTNVLSDEKQNKTTIDYGNPLVDPAVIPAANCAAKAMYPVVDSGPTCDANSGLSSSSNKLRSNDYYVYYHDGSSTTLGITYSAVATYSAADLDINVYSYSHSVFEDCYSLYGYQFSQFGGAVRSARRYGSTENGSEVVSFAGLPAGYYLVNVRAYTLNKTSAALSSTASQYTFNITKNGVAGNICPRY